jgi:hypothetical protein
MLFVRNLDALGSRGLYRGKAPDAGALRELLVASEDFELRVLCLGAHPWEPLQQTVGRLPAVDGSLLECFFAYGSATSTSRSPQATRHPNQ